MLRSDWFWVCGFQARISRKDYEWTRFHEGGHLEPKDNENSWVRDERSEQDQGLRRSDANRTEKARRERLKTKRKGGASETRGGDEKARTSRKCEQSESASYPKVNRKVAENQIIPTQIVNRV